MLRILLAVIALAVATPAAAQPAGGASPGAVADAFFKGLQAGDVPKAYADMWRGTLMSKKQADVENVVNQTQGMLKYFGNVVGWEVIDSKSLSPSFVETTYLLRTENGPLFFRM
ncbi:MAG: hypothetical protein JWP23_1863 [Phenylobacterium sp.]|nr:hypothetical protein [Phenylobacterium sp.]